MLIYACMCEFVCVCVFLCSWVYVYGCVGGCAGEGVGVLV